MKKLLVLLLVAMMVLSACTPATPSPAVSQPTAAATEKPAATVAATAAPVKTTEAPAKTAEATVAPTEAPAKTAEPTQAPAAGPKELTVGLGQESYPRRGWTIETDDGFAMAYVGFLETLVKVDYDGSMVPNLAESWSQVDDTTWQFNLRKGVTFTNGEPFNADAVVKSLNYIINSPTPPRGITKTTFASIEAKDENTVLIKTAAKDTLVPNRLTSPVTGILAPSAYKAASGPIDPFNTGTGPFILTEEVPDQSLTVVKNPNYWGGKVNLDKVTILYVPDAQIRAGMLQTGEIDLDIHVPVEQVPVLKEDKNVQILELQTPRTTTLHMNLKKAPFDNVKVRQAINYALDKQAIVDATLEGIGAPAIGPIAPSEGWFNKDLKGFTYDPEKAKALLTEAGIEAGKLTVSLWTYPTRANLPPTAVAIQKMLGDVGINVDIRIAQYDPMEPEVLGGNYDMFIISRNHVLDTYDPVGFFSSDYSCKGSFNMDQFCDPKFDELLAQASTLTDPEARNEIYRQLQTILVDDQAVGAFLNYTVVIDGVGSRVLNFKVHPLERFLLTADLDVAQ